MTTAQQTEELRREIRRHDHLYYNADQPEISDSDYDRLFARLKELEATSGQHPPADSPTQRVTGQPSDRFAAVQHDPPMLSLANAATNAEFRDWLERTSRDLHHAPFTMTAELKIDGLAVNLDYRDGILVQAATRGDGRQGEDVTHTVRTIRNLPLRLVDSPAGLLRVRGEAYLPMSAFYRINDERQDAGEEMYSNPRNAAAGAIRQLDPAAAYDRNLRIWVYSLNHAGQELPDSHWQNLDYLARAGLPVNPHRIHAGTLQEVSDYYQAMLEMRHRLDYATDGIVVKVDHLPYRRRLGDTSHEPRWAVAWKFPSSRAEASLRSITVSVGRFGKLTPVANLDPVEIDGTIIRHASLHNENDLSRKDIRAGDRVVVERAGGVIPQVVAPVSHNPERRADPFHMPEHCPECQSQIRHYPEEAAHWCVNPSCPAQVLQALEHFVSREALDIRSMGPVVCRNIIAAGLIDNPGDIFFLAQAQLQSLHRMGNKSAQRLHHNIQDAKRRPLQRVLYALGVFRLGRYVSNRLAQNWQTIDEVLQLDHQQLIAMEGISDTIAGSVLDGLQSIRVQDTIQSMREAQALPQPKEVQPAMTQPINAPEPIFKGLNICLTGTLASMTRAVAHQHIRAMQGNPQSDANGKTDVLIIGEKPGSKVGRAKNASHWNEQDFLERIQTAYSHSESPQADEQGSEAAPVPVGQRPPAQQREQFSAPTLF